MADKLKDRSIIAHFVRYPKELMGYYYFPQGHHVIISQNIISKKIIYPG